MRNALWNGTDCNCKPADGETNRPADVFVNGACCPENSYFDWKAPPQGDGACVCNAATLWNGTHCQGLLPTAALATNTKLAVALGVGVGSVLILVTCMIAILSIRKRRKRACGSSGPGKPAQQYPFATASAGGPAVRPAKAVGL